MGFMDKLKALGKSAAKGALTAAVKKYGTVNSEEYRGCSVASGNNGTELVFIKVTSEQGRLNIAEEVERMELTVENLEKGRFEVQLMLKNGGCHKISLMRDDSKNQAKTAEGRIQAMYQHIADFLKILLKHNLPYSNETKEVINLIMRYTNNPQI